MKSLWEEMSSKVEKQSKITDALILKMTNLNYRRKVNKLMVYEVIGAFVCLLGLLFMAVNFYKLDTWYLQVCSFVSAVILILLPVFSIKALCRMSRINISENNYQQTLVAYSKGKVQFLMVQKASFYVGAILLVSLLPVMGKLITGHDFFKVSNIWLVYAISFPFFYYYAVWVWNNYTKSVLDAENILKELAESA